MHRLEERTPVLEGNNHYLNDEEIAANMESADHYVANAARYRAALDPIV